MRSLIGLLCLFVLAAPAVADGGVDDEQMQERLFEVWDEIQGLYALGSPEEADQLQRGTAEELWRYYLLRPDSETAQRALESAFAMWGNLGAAERVASAVPRIDRDSAVWANLMTHIDSAFAGDSAKRLEGLRDKLRLELTHPHSRAALLLQIGETQHDREAALEAFGEVVRLDAAPGLTSRAKGHIYELQTLDLGLPAPDFQAIDMDGRPLALSDLVGNVVLLEFWSTTCDPCIPEIDRLKEMRRENAGAPLRIVGIALDHQAGSVARVVAEKQIDWPQICDEQGYDGAIAARYNVWRIPRSYLVDADGRIAAKDLRGETLRQEVHRLLSATKSAP